MFKRVVFAIAMGAALCSCNRYDTPPGPTPFQYTPPLIPARIALQVVPGVGNAVTTAAVSATVLDAAGAGVGGVTVNFSTTVGTFSRPSVVTDIGGLAQTTLTSVKPATITAAAGPLSTTTNAPINADLQVSFITTPPVVGTATGFSASAFQANGPVQFRFDFGDGSVAGPGPSTASHFYGRPGSYNIQVTAVDAIGRSGGTSSSLTVADVPSSGSGGGTTTGTPTLTISLTCTAGAHTVATPCNVTANYGGSALPGASITNVDWDWGDGVADLTHGQTSSHNYFQAGGYTVFATVTATTTDGSKTATTSKAITIS